MFYWTVLFLLIAIIAAALGLVIPDAGGASTARILFSMFAVLFAVSLLGGAIRRP